MAGDVADGSGAFGDDVLVVEHCGQLMTCERAGSDALGLLRDGAVVSRDGVITWVGATADLEHCGLDLASAARVDAGGRLVTPGLVDCHAHPIYAGDRAAEFAMRAAGADYRDIAAAGGGIAATLEPTRAATDAELVATASQRLTRALAGGTTTCEAKSGYDLTVAGELRLLSVASAVDDAIALDVSPTLLGAHVVPPEHKADRGAYVDAVVNDMIPAAAERGLATAVDVYCDEGAFTLDESRAILTAGARAGLSVRAHAGQFADLGAPQLVAELSGASADHLEAVSADGIAAMASAEVTAVMLPGACVQLRCPVPPVAALRDAGVALAVASDMNPGSTAAETLPVAMWLAATHYSMTVEEVWLGVTANAARVLRRADIGRVAVGCRGDLVLWDADLPAEIPYRYDRNLVFRVFKDAAPV